MFNPPRLLASLVLSVALITSGCGSDDSSPGASGNVSDLQPGDDGFHEQMLEWAQCLRENGADVEDPAPGEGVALGATSAAEQAANDKAIQACADLAPGGPPSEEDEEAERDQALAFAKCMREHGVEKFQDPKPGEGTHLDPEIAEDPDFEAANKACNEEIFGGQPDTQEQDAS